MITIEPFDPRSASDDELRRYYDLNVVLDNEVEPDDPTPPLERALQEYVDPPSWTGHQRWIARAGDELVGRATLELEYKETNRYIGGVDVGLLPAYRHQGLATRLLEPLVAAAQTDGRTVLESWAIDDTEGDRFAASLGGESRYLERRSRLVTAELDRAMLEDWVAKAAERAGEYSLVAFDGDCPAELFDQYLIVTDVMNTAPRENLDMEDEHWTEERLRERYELDKRHGNLRWNIVARHDPTGELAGYTEIEWSDYMDDLVWQGGTAVDPSHREKGLGRWLKAAMLLRLLDERPGVARVDTWNAGTNAPMLGINVALGFRPLKYYNARQIATDALAEAVARRL